MEAELNKQTNLSGTESTETAGGRLFQGGAVANSDASLDADIEKNIRIRTMPKKFKVSTDGTDKKTTVVGAVIMIVGVLVLGAAVYLAYIFLINPKAQTPSTVTTVPKKEEVTPPANSSVTTPTPTVTAPVVTSPVATTTPVVTPPIVTPIATSTTSTATSTAVSSSTTSTEGLPAGAKISDSDRDGLSDQEELIFGTDPFKTDSDGDGFSDGAEVTGLYNPAGLGKIVDNSYVGVFQNTLANYSVDYPKIWHTQNVDGGATVMFVAADNSFVQIVTQANDGKLGIKDWYNKQFPETPATDSSIISHDGWQGIMHQDKETIYLTDNLKKNIYTISYNPSNPEQPSFYHIFLMMVSSFAIK